MGAGPMSSSSAGAALHGVSPERGDAAFDFAILYQRRPAGGRGGGGGAPAPRPAAEPLLVSSVVAEERAVR